jgi:uncharacterized membrane protein
MLEFYVLGEMSGFYFLKNVLDAVVCVMLQISIYKTRGTVRRKLHRKGELFDGLDIWKQQKYRNL